MKVRVTLSRLVRQYAEIDVQSVETIEEAINRIEEELREKGAPRARRLRGLEWTEHELQELETVVGGEEV